MFLSQQKRGWWEGRREEANDKDSRRREEKGKVLRKREREKKGKGSPPGELLTSS